LSTGKKIRLHTTVRPTTKTAEQQQAVEVTYDVQDKEKDGPDLKMLELLHCGVVRQQPETL
jgi:hypothetical protein